MYTECQFNSAQIKQVNPLDDFIEIFSFEILNCFPMNTGRVNARGDLRCSESAVGVALGLAGYPGGGLYFQIMILIQSFQFLDISLRLR